MFAEKPEKGNQLLAEKLWLLHFNDVLYRDGIITQDAYHKMIHRVNSRSKTVSEQQKS